MAELWRHHTARGSYLGDDARAFTWRGRARRIVGEVRDNRTILRVFTVSRFRARFRAQALGVIWPVANPLILMIVMSVVFGLVFRNDVRAYPVFLMLGLVLWQFLTHAWTEATTCMVSHAAVVKRTSVPSWVVVAGTVLSHLFTLAFASLALVPLVAFYPEAFRVSFALLSLPLWLALVVAFALGLSLTTSVLNVFYRDVHYIVDSTLLVLFWATPIVWPLEQVGEGVRPWLLMNPIAAMLEGIRAAVMDGRFASGEHLTIALAGSATMLIVGVAIYARLGDRIADQV
jgi:ABC-type polysaccharide/polyol phosphate export permease